MFTSQVTDHTIAATVHGRFLVRGGPPERLILGFHGYAQTAEILLDEVLKIDRIDRWTLASVQALHPFYSGRTQQVVASWMTRLDRELAIADNINYTRGVIDWLHRPATIVFAGYSQGAAMAYRTASDCEQAVGLMVLGGDVPPD